MRMGRLRVFFFLALLGAFCVAHATRLVAAPQGSRFNAAYFTNAEVITHEGQRVRFYDELIKDKVVVISFVYLSCNDICPLTSARIAEVRDLLGDAVGRDVFFYSITIDPENDTPDQLADHAEAFGAGNGWYFLTGRPEDIHAIRWRLGERSRSLGEHRNHIVLGNERTGEWSRSSIMSNLETVADRIRELDAKMSLDIAAPALAAYGDKDLRIDDRVGQALFAKACASCHTIGGGDKIGPDLRDLTKRREVAWLNRYLSAPERLRASDDPIALSLRARFKGVRMPNLGLGDNDIADLITYIERRSAAAATPPATPAEKSERTMGASQAVVSGRGG